LKKEQNGYISHEEIDSVLDRAQLVLFNQYHTNPKVPALTARYGESQRIDDALSAFKARYTFTTADTGGGVVSLPSNYMHLISLYTTTYSNVLQKNIFNAVQVLNEEELIERLNSQVIPVTSDDPICIMNASNKIQLFPDIPQSGGVYYFRRPAVPKYNYTLSGRTETYVSNGSQDLEWRSFDILNIITIALSYYSIRLSAEDVLQFAELKTAQGQ
jgi:hypothetical protein